MTTPARSRDQKSAPIDDPSPRPSLYPMDYEPVAARPVGVMLVGPDREGSFRVPLLRPAMAMPEGLGGAAA